MIDFTRAFDSAWERMMVILFRPFDLAKWFVIGFSAFLAGLMEGGNGVNFRYNQNFNFNSIWNPNGSTNLSQSHQPDWQHLHASIMGFFNTFQLGVIILIALVAFAIIILVGLVIFWLGARGQFLFLDNIVRNRGAISWPWVSYTRPANSLFLFYLAIMLLSFVIFLPILIVGIVMAIPLFQQDRWPVGEEIAGFIVLGLIYLVLALAVNLVLFLFREFGIPLMFRNGLKAREAFLAVLDLIMRHPGSVVLFLLLRVAIAIGVVIISVVVCCATCCIAIIPYVGTVILLPVLIYVRCFTLDCLAQFGPQYDVWTVDVPPGGPAVPPAFNPPPPPG